MIINNSIELTNICNDAGWDCTPIKVKNGIKVCIWEGNKVKRIGNRIHKNWHHAQFESYLLIYKHYLPKELRTLNL